MKILNSLYSADGDPEADLDDEFIRSLLKDLPIDPLEDDLKEIKGAYGNMIRFAGCDQTPNAEPAFKMLKENGKKLRDIADDFGSWRNDNPELDVATALSVDAAGERLRKEGCSAPPYNKIRCQLNQMAMVLEAAIVELEEECVDVHAGRRREAVDDFVVNMANWYTIAGGNPYPSHSSYPEEGKGAQDGRFVNFLDKVLEHAKKSGDLPQEYNLPKTVSILRWLTKAKNDSSKWNGGLWAESPSKKK